MDNEKLVNNWHRTIIDESEKRLKRKLTKQENAFITSRGGFMALETIEDTVTTMSKEQLVDYLNSEAND